jgi:hypothetical protein
MTLDGSMNNSTLSAGVTAAHVTPRFRSIRSLSRFCGHRALLRYRAPRLIKHGRRAAVGLGCRDHIPVSAYERLLERKIAKCRDVGV